MHNVIGLGRNSERILKNLATHLSDTGMAFIMAPNKYHAFDFNYSNPQELRRIIEDGTVKFKRDMPEMFCYTPIEFKNLLHRAGFGDVIVLGYPVTVAPVKADAFLLKKETNDFYLKHPYYRRLLLEYEKKLCLNPDLAYRGRSSLIAICKKQSQ